MTTINVCVIIAAAGQSARFGQSDKLSADLGGRAVLLRTVEAFARRDEVRSILVAAPPERFDAFREKFGPTIGFHGASIVEGGRTERWESVRNALAAVPDDATHVAVHDAARPAVSSRMLDRLFEAAAAMPAVVPGIPVGDTVKRVGGESLVVDQPEDDVLADTILGDAGKASVEARPVVETVDRTGLVLVQTPQVFEIGLLRRAYDEVDPAGCTDDAMVVERLGETVVVVEGDVKNFKITVPEDIPLMRAVLGLKPPADRPVHKRF